MSALTPDQGTAAATKPGPNTEFEELTAAIRAFAQARDWEQFHRPKNLAMALAVEAAELMEPLQWAPAQEAGDIDASCRAALRDEIADVQIYLLRLADVLEIDVPVAVRDKLARNAQRYPVDKARGNALKYPAFREPAGGD